MVMKQEELLAPGVCALCEGAEPHLEYYDTGYLANMDWDYMGGVKYVCERCFRAQAEFWGWVASDQVQEAREAIERAKAEVTDLYNTLQTQVNTVMDTWREVNEIPIQSKGKIDVSKERAVSTD